MSELSSDESNEPVESVLVDSLLPPGSKNRYLSVYGSFMKWKDQHNVKTFSEDVFLTYFNEISKTRKPSSLWGVYSMLKSTMRAKHNIYFKDYINLTLWLRKRNAGYQSNKSKILTPENIKKFIDEAPDDRYLATKVAIIIGVCGGCRSVELTAITVNDIKLIDSNMIGKALDSINKTEKLFAIRDDFIPVVQKYQALRPIDIETSRFFLNFRDGHCTKQVIGRHKMAALPKEIAKYLNLPNPERYTGHCYRRSAAAFGGQVTSLDKNKDKFRCSNQQQFVDMLEFAKNYKGNNSVMPKCIAVEVERMEDEIYIDNEEMGLETAYERDEMESATEEEIYIKTEPTELAHIDVMHIKTEEVEVTTVNELQNEIVSVPQMPTDAIDFKTKEGEATDWNVSTALETVKDKQSTAQARASDSGRELRSTDIVIEDSDGDEEDLVRIKSDNVDRKISLQSLREESPQETSSPYDTKLTVAGKNITVIFKNCTNVGNVTVNIINK